jgi:hypothetical protein
MGREGRGKTTVSFEFGEGERVAQGWARPLGRCGGGARAHQRRRDTRREKGEAVGPGAGPRVRERGRDGGSGELTGLVIGPVGPKRLGLGFQPTLFY